MLPVVAMATRFAAYLLIQGIFLEDARLELTCR